jgi:hypothetical protein
MQCAWAIFSSVACTALRNCFKLFHKRQDFGGDLKNEMCVTSFSTTSVSNIFYSTSKNRARYDQICTLVFM